MRYDAGEVYVFDGHDLEFWSYFELFDLTKELDLEFEVDYVKLWWKYKSDSLKEDLNPFMKDSYA